MTTTKSMAGREGGGAARGGNVSTAAYRIFSWGTHNIEGSHKAAQSIGTSETCHRNKKKKRKRENPYGRKSKKLCDLQSKG